MLQSTGKMNFPLANFAGGGQRGRISRMPTSGFFAPCRGAFSIFALIGRVPLPGAGEHPGLRAAMPSDNAARRAVVVVLLVQGALLPVVAFGFPPFQLPAGRFGVRGERHSALLLHPLQQLGQCCGCLLHVLAPVLPRFSPRPSSPSWDSCPPSSRWRCSSP